MKAEGLKSEEELQSWFIRRIERFLNAKGRKLIGWDEILEGGLPPKAAVMSWRGTEGGIAAAKSLHPVVMTPTSNCYFDYYQGDPSIEPLAIGGFLPLSKVYAFEPVPAGLSPEESSFIIGVQANLWTEYVATPAHARYMIFPRIAAMAEAGWSAREGRNWEDFLERMEAQFRRYEAMGINYARSIYAVKIVPSLDGKRKKLQVRMESESFRPDIRYTLDGTEPTAGSKAYREPLVLKKTTNVKAGVFAEGRLLGPVMETRFLAHFALGRTPGLRFPFQPRYSGGGPTALVDGLRGGKSHSDGRWQGFEGDDLVAMIDLGRRVKLQEVEVGFLQNTESWIFFPRSVEIAVSDDGKDFQVVRIAGQTAGDDVSGVPTKAVRLEVGGIRTRFIRLTAVSIRTCPKDHSGAGQKAWLFADEIVVR